MGNVIFMFVFVCFITGALVHGKEWKKQMETIVRIQKMEQLYDDVLAASHTGRNFIEDESIGEKIRELTDYYENGLWLQDYECDERGELPKNLKRGVLSQDGLYNLLSKS